MTITCVLAAIPLAAFGDDATSGAATSAATSELLEVRASVEQVNEMAVEEAPPAVGRSCGATLDVDGIGDTCVDGSGLLRVEQADGRSHTIHGLDAPPIGANGYTPASQAAIAGAGSDDVTCVGNDQPHYTLVYARPGNVGSRFGAIAPLLRSEVYKVSAFIDSESRSVDPAAGRRLPVRCDGGSEPVVLNATLDGLSAGSANFGNIVDGLRALGYQFNGDGGGTERYIVYYDSPSPSGAAGTGHVFTSDSSAGAGNQNNKGGLYSVEYRFDQGGGVPHWEVLVHEVMHTMGAVVSGAPHSTNGGHCRDGEDVMCYDDDGPAGISYNSSVCATKVLDCNRDDYFNPAPGAGSYLATHWNAAATYNRFLVGHAGGSIASDVGGLLQTGASRSAVGISWTSSGAPSYAVAVRSPGGAWTHVTTTTRSAATISGLAAGTTYEASVASRSSNGATGTPTVITITTSLTDDTTAPSRPGRVVVRQRAGTVTFAWTDASDDVGIQAFQLRRVTRTARGRSTRSAGTTSNTTLTIRTRGLRPGSTHVFEVVAFDDAGNASPPSAVSVRIAADRVRPRRIARLRATGRTATTITLGWTASRDDVELTHYVVTQQVGRRWVRIGRPLAASRRAVRVNGLRRASTYVFRVQARDSAGNLSLPSAAVRARTA